MIQNIVGYRFNDEELLNQALTHRSASGLNNERLEFLGDAVLGLMVAELTYRRYPEQPEGQLAKKETLEEKVVEFESAALKIRRDIDDRRTACELLQLCSATTREKVGPTLSSYLKCILPRLTEGRYRDVKLDPELNIQVFADDRSDFISAIELSGGTNEALMLGLRLALSQAHVTSRARQQQFMFLDEPFKMMDSTRVVGALESLGKLSEELRQFFVVQPRCEQEQIDVLDHVIRTSVELTELEIDFSSVAPGESFDAS